MNHEGEHWKSQFLELEQDAGQHIGMYSEVYIVLQNNDSDQNYINEAIVQMSKVLFLSKKLAAVLNRKYTYAHSTVFFNILEHIVRNQ